jgi:beta-glucosidase/6-phospho-beta-glucosidase/beta-galactosidase
MAGGVHDNPLLMVVNHFPFLTGFESTQILGTGKDVLGGTRHIEKFRHDLDLVKAAGVVSLRYPVPWHRIEKKPGQYDWRWMDAALEHMRILRLDPIADPIHHTSFPEWIEGGFAHPKFPDFYQIFVEHFARRYPWVKRYTVFNEPFVTTLFCGNEGIWYPHRRSPRSFVRMALHVGRAICQASESLQRMVPGLELVHVDTCEHHQAVNAGSREKVEFLNHRRFLFHDLILGRIDSAHPLHGYLIRHGMKEEDLRWFRAHPARIDVLGLDYYPHSEQQRHARGIRFVSSSPRGFAAVAGDYIERYGLPVMLSETNIKGFVSDRLSWMKHMLEECGKLVSTGADFRGFCWFPFIDSTDWCSLVCRAAGKVDAVGIYWLDSGRWERHGSELSRCFARLARGQMSVSGIPAYRFQHPWDRDLEGFRAFMRHWDWVEPRVSGTRKLPARAGSGTDRARLWSPPAP